MNPWSDSDGFARQAAKVESAGEAVLLTLLWWRRAGWTVRAQEPLGDYRIDLFIPEARVAIEVDSFAGHSSGGAMEHDAKKRNLVVAKGWAPLTFSAREALFRTHDTLATILAQVEQRLPPKRHAGRDRWGDVASPNSGCETPPLEVSVEGGNRLLDAIGKVIVGEALPRRRP